MDNQMMLTMLNSMLDKMSNQELATALNNIKTIVSPQDYEKILALIKEKHSKNNSYQN